MAKSEIIISGPELIGSVMHGSIAEYLVPKMKSRPKDFIAQVDYATNESITSHEFLCKCLEVAEGLIEFGLKKRDIVVIITSSPSIPTVITSVGVILSGGVLAPVEGLLKTREMQHIFKQLQPKYVICEKAKAREIQKRILSVNLNTKIVLIDSSDSEEFFNWRDIKTKVDVENYVPRQIEDPEKDIAIINCSSGSTGMPKGIGLTHASLLLFLSLTEATHAPEENTALLFSSPLYWISGSVQVLTSCYFGMTRYVPKSSSPDHILEAMEKCKPYFFMSTPAGLRFLIGNSNFQKYDLSSVKFIISAGAVLGAALASKIMDTWKGPQIVNFYGLTETCGEIISSFGVEDLNAVGKVRPEAKVKVVDPFTGESLGPNQTGECRIKSKTLMRGYYNNEEETKAAFDEKGWFCTGDLAYYNEDEVFYIVGRIKESINFRNFEISPAEIEDFIISLPGVKDVAIVPVPDEVDLNHLRALVVKDPGSSITAQDIIDGVKENFVERKHLTAGVQFVQSLPRSEVGKLKRVEVKRMINIETNTVYYDRKRQ